MNLLRRGPPRIDMVDCELQMARLATAYTLPRRAALAVYMGGGPAAVSGRDALRACDQFSGPKT